MSIRYKPYSRHVRHRRPVQPILLVPLVLVWGGAGWWVGWAPAAVAVAALTAWTTDRALSIASANLHDRGAADQRVLGCTPIITFHPAARRG